MTEAAATAAAAEVLAGDQAPHRRIQQARARQDCANCGAHLLGDYCHKCGQRGRLHTRIWHLAEDFVQGLLHFDGRLWRTLPLLAFRPGRLSRAWIEGKRVRYLAPLHIFLFSLFLFFFGMNVLGADMYTKLFEGISRSTSQAAAAPAPPATGAPAATSAPSPPAAPAPPGVQVSRSAEASIQADNSFFRDCVARGREAYEDWKCEGLLHIRDNPQLYALKAEEMTYNLAPLLVPFSIGILAVLLLFKRGYTLYDHGVVSLYGLSFLALLMTIALLLNRVLPGEWPMVVLFAVTLHAIVHLRGAYRLSWFGSVLRTLVMGVLVSIVLGFFLLGVVAVSAYA